MKISVQRMQQFPTLQHIKIHENTRFYKQKFQEFAETVTFLANSCRISQYQSLTVTTSHSPSRHFHLTTPAPHHTGSSLDSTNPPALQLPSNDHTNTALVAWTGSPLTFPGSLARHTDKMAFYNAPFTNDIYFLI